MRHSIVQSFTFHAAHHLSWHPGRCAAVHGHTYKFEVRIEGNLDEHEIVVDFDELETTINAQILSRLDHTDLNTVFANPTAERIAGWIFETISNEFPGVREVRLWETPESSVVVER